MRILKMILKTLCLFIIVGSVYFYRNDISRFIIDKLFYKQETITYNSYYNRNNYLYVSNTDEFIAENYQDLLNIFYTIINSGSEKFTFKCSPKYKTCAQDVKNFDEDTLASINNYVHPYNSYQNISINVSNYGNVKVSISPIYTNTQIDYINAYLKEFIKNNIKDDMSNRDKIQIFHDYIINNTIYDSATIDSEGKINTKNFSHTAYGLLKNHKAICGGYTDIMAIYLYLLGINNYRIATENHVWNYVYIDGTWYHLDLTFDDPVASDGNQYLKYDYFLIDTETIERNDSKEHIFDYEIYKEAAK